MKQVPAVGETGIAEAKARALPGLRSWPSIAGWVRSLLLVGSLVLFGLHFVHLRADFPHGSPWNDWSKYTDEGWYGDGAIRHFALGHWFLAGDFNPAVAMPVWPLLEAAVFAVTGVSLAAARALAVAVFGVALLALYGLLEHRRATAAAGGSGLGAPLAVFLACANPFLFAFDRLAILEPLVAALGLGALWVASSVAPDRRPVAGWARFRYAGRAVGLGVLLALLGLSKPTAIALFPAIVYLLWRSAGEGRRAAVRLLAVPATVAAAIWLAYFALLVHLHLLADYRYLFDANAYTGFGLQPLSEVARNTLWDGCFVGGWLYGLFAVAMASMVLLRRRFFHHPLVGALLVWMGGYLLLLGYHNNLQPRYYLPLAFAVIALLVLALEEALAWAATSGSPRKLYVVGWVMGACVGVVAVPGIRQEADYLRHPEYTYLAAAQGIAAIVHGDPRQSPWVLSVSGSDLTLMTGLPSIDDDFGTLNLDERVRAYRPGWYVAWNEIDDDKMDALRPLYQPVRVAAFPAMDDPDRNLLILYRLDRYRPDPAGDGAMRRRSGRRPPQALRTRRGQQPDTPQLRH